MSLRRRERLQRYETIARLVGLRRRSLPKRRKTYARFYGRFRSMAGQTRGFEFQVRVSNSLSPKAKCKAIRDTVMKMKYDNLMPIHKRRETFSSFRELYNTDWVRIRRLLDYDVEMDYPTPFD